MDVGGIFDNLDDNPGSEDDITGADLNDDEICGQKVVVSWRPQLGLLWNVGQ